MYYCINLYSLILKQLVIKAIKLIRYIPYYFVYNFLGLRAMYSLLYFKTVT